jgi:DNA-binding LytR/AlgR family response regulator
LLLALVASLALGYLLGVSAGDWGFEAVRRLPALAASAGVIALLRSAIDRRSRTGRDLPLLPRQIDWVGAAGNYVELRAGDRTIVHRSSIAAVEKELAPHGFVRIHRSLLVRRERIAKVRPQDIVLHDGTHLKVGKRYRTALAG